MHEEIPWPELHLIALCGVLFFAAILILFVLLFFFIYFSLPQFLPLNHEADLNEFIQLFHCKMNSQKTTVKYL